MAAGDQVQQLSGDLVPFISQPGVSLLVVQLQATRWTHKLDRDEGVEVEAGPVTFRTLEVLHGRIPHKGDIIEAPARRIADPLIRVRNRFDQWNALTLEPRDILILACQRGGAPLNWKVLGAIQIVSPNAPEVAAIRRCYEIEEFRGSPGQRSLMIEEALKSDQDLLRYYGLDYLARHAETNRESAVEMIRTAIASASTAPAHRLELGRQLTNLAFFNPSRKADHANQAVVASLAMGLVSESDPERRLTWARLLASSVLIEFSPEPEKDKQVRSALIRFVQAPSAARVIEVLSEVAARATGGEKEIVNRLLKAWQCA
jgi:hypothetical protein